ncbi:helix-turn-helix domain-containing protein [Haloflavibacter putidus]|uniref:Helix-turn-helix transcriptional regulator n=1 Tax=Haloflavibacter putidus TaxID=2576776 RepID=A0A507ZRQ4_9FLAO|nr:helix-turn-helix transcriptional regulator [Haloflavibacter putidus]TQD39687.1 helix-turn-helix transcriptional regulator [Haloflavibacter putidus]
MNSTATPHIGRKISRIRELRGMKQEALALELGVSQQTVSHLEQSETIEEDKLDEVAKVLGVSKEAIENFSEENLIYNIQNNYEGSNKGASSVSVSNLNCTFNPLDKLVEAHEENKKLYERLLTAEKEKVAYLEKIVKK